MKKYWLMKSEPSVYSIYDLQKSKKDLWDGVRNYQARNFMMKEMQVGDEALFYHSNARPPAVTGRMRISKVNQPDLTALNPRSKYYDPKATRTHPIWFCAEVQFQAVFKRFVPLEELRKQAPLRGMWLLKKGQRLSVLPLSQKEHDYILKLASSP